MPNVYKKFPEVYTLKDIQNYPSQIDKAIIQQKKNLGIPFQQNAIPKKMNATKKNNNKKVNAYKRWKLRQEIERILYNNNNNNNIPEFRNLNTRSRSTTKNSNPRSVSPSLQGGRKTRKHRKH